MTQQQMYVRDCMSVPVRSISAETRVTEAYDMMMRLGIRRLPVVEDGHLVGIVTLSDLREAKPTRSTSLSIYELHYMLATMTVGQVMSLNPYTIGPDGTLRDAARLMREHRIGGLPVIDCTGRLVGVITESDVFETLMERWDYYSARPAEAKRHAPHHADGFASSS